jgi:septal ring factor EnvC (AmiA/AmiB activator)
MTGVGDVLMGELDALRVKLAEAEQRAAVAEAIATERERIIQTQAMALRMLEASKAPAHAPSDIRPDTPASSHRDNQETPIPGARRRWWHRL